MTGLGDPPARLLPADITVVIPAIDEEAAIGEAVRSAKQAGAGEVIVVDGGSSDRTMEVARQSGASKLVRSIRGRGIQMNSGALLVDPNQLVVLFLHADNRLGESCLQQICQHPQAMWGAFRQQIDSSAWIYRWIEWGNSLRVRIRRVPFGDQGIFVLKEVFDRVGGFEEIALMEDVSLSHKLRRLSPPLLLNGPIMVSSRRWRRRGPVRQTLRNWMIQIAYALGTPPERLKKWYG